MAGTQEPEVMSTKQLRIAALAERFPQRAFTSLAHYIDAQWLKTATLMTRHDGAVGIDGQTADDFVRDFEANIQRLLEDAKSGRYKAPPVRRIHIPKGDGRSTRPIGIPTFEDKVLQRAVVALLDSGLLVWLPAGSLSASCRQGGVGRAVVDERWLGH